MPDEEDEVTQETRHRFSEPGATTPPDAREALDAREQSHSSHQSQQSHATQRRRPTSERAHGAAGPRHLPGLDGLRALAIIAVLLFHLDPRWLPGGFLGVDVFFVVSGFLITTLLVRERAETGRVDLGGFWKRRARRLLPALLLVVPACILLARLVEGDLLVAIGRQALGALTFSSNWLEIAAGTDYFAATSPQLFMNFWSLAVEEQFYLVWPLVTLLLLAVVPSWRARAALAGAAGLGSALLMATKFDPAEGATRVYYGTDTHLMGLMLGAALAFSLAGPDRAGLDSPLWERRRRPILLSALLVLGGLFLVATEDHPFTFRGGILLASAATTVLVAGAVDRPGRLRTVLEFPALRWIGARSYGIYLWHWPVILVVGQDIPASPGTGDYVWTKVWAVVATLALADLSYTFLETPVRRHGFRGSLRRTLAFIGRPSSRRGKVVLGALVAVSLVTAIVIATAPEKSSTQRMIEANAAAAQGATTRESADSGKEKSAATSPDKDSGTSADAKKIFAMPTGTSIDVFGDSMVVGSVPALQYYFPGIRLDAKSNRRWSDGLKAVTSSGATTRRAVVLAFGTNAGVDEEALRTILDELGPRRMVVLVTIHGSRLARAADDNKALAEIAADYDNVGIADWDKAVAGHPDQLQPDGIHPSLTGQHLYASTIRQGLADLSEAHTGKKPKLKDLPLP
ncbi:acyltransferase family protein [Janibacter sp. G1551]|uniref:acyltransferase family protein n=1 Tax=Janibacter sp. G1551 TaxID=3420440 RepID=UPI003D06D9B0